MPLNLIEALKISKYNPKHTTHTEIHSIFQKEKIKCPKLHTFQKL